MSVRVTIKTAREAQLAGHWRAEAEGRFATGASKFVALGALFACAPGLTKGRYVCEPDLTSPNPEAVTVHLYGDITRHVHGASEYEAIGRFVSQHREALDVTIEINTLEVPVVAARQDDVPTQPNEEPWR